MEKGIELVTRFCKEWKKECDWKCCCHGCPLYGFLWTMKKYANGMEIEKAVRRFWATSIAEKEEVKIIEEEVLGGVPLKVVQKILREMKDV